MRRTVLHTALVSLALASAAYAQAVKLEPKFTEGSRRNRTEVRTHQVLTIGGMAIETRAEVDVDNRVTTGKPDAEGNVRMEEVSERMRMKISLPGGDMVELDTSKPDEQVSNPTFQPLADGFRALIGKAVTLVVGKDGRVQRVEGLENLAAALPPGAEAQLQQQIGRENVIREANQRLGMLPDQAVQPGARWKRTEAMDIGGGQTLVFDIYYDYQGTVEKDGKKLDKIGILVETVQYRIEPGSPIPLELKGSDLKIDSSMGTVLFDREAGEVVSSSRLVRITGGLLFGVNGMDLPGNLDLTMEVNWKLVE